MRVIALEEHFQLPFVAERIGSARIAARGFPVSGWNSHLHARLIELGAARIADLDEHGISLQVLSSSGPGAELLEGQAGEDLAREMNDALHRVCVAHPERFGGFAHLPMGDPLAAARELRRAVQDLGFCGALVNGLTQGKFLDDPTFGPLLAEAEALDVPIYLHPALPPPAVAQAYYSGLPGNSGFMLSTGGWGWHSETAIHVLRLVLSGTFDRHRRLKLIIGHMGEGLPMMMARCDNVLGPTARNLTRSISQTVCDQVWITTSGSLTIPPFLAALTTFGADRILFSVDYPYTSNDQARPFLTSLPVSAADRDKIAFRNAEKLLKIPSVGD